MEMPPMSNTIVSARLEKRARDIVEALDGHWSRSRGMCRCPAHDDRTPSLSVSLGSKAILFHCFAGCPNAAVIRGLAKIGVTPRDLFNGSDTVIAATPCEDGVDRNAFRLWLEASPLKPSPAGAYLAQRGIALSSPELRFHPRMPLGPRGEAQFLPAMAAAVRNDLGILALHRTFIETDGPRLARFDRPRRALGRLGTGAVRLAAPRDGKLGLAEGIETALSVIQLFDIPCWATLGNERFGLVTIPESVSELHLFIDADAGGNLAEKRAGEAYARDGRAILTHRPDRDGDDWNDVLRARQPATA